MTDDPSPYEFADGIPVNAVAPGTTLFVGGSEINAAETLTLSLVLGGRADGEGAVLLSTNTTATRLLDRCRPSDLGDPDALGAIDCSGQQAEDERAAHFATVSSPQDLTGLGIEFSGLYERIYRSDVRKVRVGFVSVSSLLMYNDLRTVFRFLHSLTSRITGVDGLGVFVVDPNAHDAQTTNMLAQLSDGRIEVREPGTDEGDGELRVRGLPDQPTEWTPYTLPE